MKYTFESNLGVMRTIAELHSALIHHKLILTDVEQAAVVKHVADAYASKYETIGGMGWRALLIVDTELGLSSNIVTDQMDWCRDGYTVTFYEIADGCKKDVATILPSDLGHRAIMLHSTQTRQEKGRIEISVSLRIGSLCDDELRFVLRNRGSTGSRLCPSLQHALSMKN